MLFVGRAQEKATVFRTEKRRNPDTGRHLSVDRASTAMVNHFYFYAVDADFGPFFIKFCTYFPYNAKFCLNGNEWAKRQAAKAGIAFEALDNGFAACDDPARLQRICDRLDAARIDRLLRKWLARLPHPFTAADRRAGYRYDISILQAEFSLTQVLDRPLAGPGLLRGRHPREPRHRPSRPGAADLRPAHRQPRRTATPGRFRTRVITEGVTPSLHVDYKSHPGQAISQGRTRPSHRDDHQRHPGLRDRQTAAQPARPAGGRLLSQPTSPRRPTISHDPSSARPSFNQVNQPIVVDGQRVAGLRFGDPRVHALLSAIVIFRLLPTGSPTGTSRHLAPLLGLTRRQSPPGRMTYDLRRLRLHGLIERIPGTHRYRPTALGRRTALFFTHAYSRFVRTAPATSPIPPAPPHAPSPRPARRPIRNRRINQQQIKNSTQSPAPPDQGL